MSRSVRVGLVQMRCSDDPAVNQETAEQHVRDAAAAGAEIVCLPELFLSRYFCQTEDYARFDLAEAVPGPTTDAFESLASELNVVIILSLFEERAPGLYHNTAAVVDGDEGYIGKYRKMHIPDDPRYYEKFYFTPGDLGFKCFTTSRGDLGVLVCWDQWYPEAARLTALKGAEVLFYPTSIGWHPSEKREVGEEQYQAWEVAQRAHAIANGCYVVAVNRVGFEPAPDASDAERDGIEFWGQSFVAGPDGAIIQQAPVDEEAVLVVALDLSRIRTARTGWPFLRDRRIDAYGGLSSRFLDDG